MELAQIKQFEQNPAAIFKENGALYISLLLNLLAKLVRTDTIQNILVLIDDMLTERSDRAQQFVELVTAKHDVMALYTPFLKLLKKDDEYIQLKAAKILVLLLSNDPVPPQFDGIADLVHFLCNHIQNNSSALVVDLCVQFLQTFLCVHSYRLPFYQTAQKVSVLVEQAKKATTAQMQYQLFNCLWLLCLVKEVAQDLQRKYDIIPCTVEVAKSAIKEKVVRMVVAIWKQMLLYPNPHIVYAVVGNKLLALAENMLTRKFTDTEISDDLKVVVDELQKIVASLRYAPLFFLSFY